LHGHAGYVERRGRHVIRLADHGGRAGAHQRSARRRADNPNTALYALGKAQMGTSGHACDSSRGAEISGFCVFNNVDRGDMDANCTIGKPNCYAPSGTVGVLSTSTTAYQPAYLARSGWNFATGLGSVNVANLVQNWSLTTPPNHYWTVGVGDFYGDGRDDTILWRNENSNAVVLWEMSGGTVLNSGGGQTPGADWSVAGAGDFSHTGHKNWILWRNAGGQTALWQMNGGAVAASANPPTVPINWRRGVQRRRRQRRLQFDLSNRRG
jgi:hypothetical protein